MLSKHIYIRGGRATTGTGTGTNDHSALSNLTYGSSGHSGFAPDPHTHPGYATDPHFHDGADITTGDIHIDRLEDALSDYGGYTISGTGPAWFGELGIKVFIQGPQPTLSNRKALAFWENTNTGKFYLVYKTSGGVEKFVELA